MIRDPLAPLMRVPVGGVLVDLLMAVMDSMTVWEAAAADRRLGLEWRDAVTERMVASRRYTRFEDLVTYAAKTLHLAPDAPDRLLRSWQGMSPWPDAVALANVGRPYACLTNCSSVLAHAAVRRSGLVPAVVVTAEESGWYKPDPRAYAAGCRALGLSADQVLFVAGSSFDATGARRAGLRSIFVARRSDQRVHDRAIPTVASLGDVVSAIDRQAQPFRLDTQ